MRHTWIAEPKATRLDVIKWIASAILIFAAFILMLYLIFMAIPATASATTYIYDFNGSSGDDQIIRDETICSPQGGIRFGHDVDGGLVTDVFGWPVEVGIRMEYVTDVLKIDGVRFHPRHSCEPWPDPLYRPGISLWITEAHNAHIQDFFSLGYDTGVLLDGPSKALKFGMADLDIVRHGIKITGNSTQTYWSTIKAFGRGADSECGIKITGDKNIVKIDTIDIRAFGFNGIRIEGWNNTVIINTAIIHGISLHSPGWPAIEAMADQGNMVLINILIVDDYAVPYETWPRGMPGVVEVGKIISYTE